MLDFTELIVHHLADAPLWTLGPGLAFTKHMLMIAIAAALVAAFVLIGTKSPGRVGRGFRQVLEAFVEFIWQDIVEPALGEEGKHYLSYFLTLFLFILFMNLLGLVPFGASATGNISVTLALSLATFFLIQFSGIRHHGFVHHFGHMIPPGVPLLVQPLVFLLEVMGFFTRTLALCVRLFANMTAGHMVILLFLGLILLFGQSNPVAGFVVAPISIGLTLGLYGLELIVALVQAYVFTMLTAIFVGGVLHPEH